MNVKAPTQPETYFRFAARNAHHHRYQNGIVALACGNISRQVRGGKIDLKTDGMNVHLLCVPFAAGTHIVTRRQEITYEGRVEPGQIELIPAGRPVHWTVEAPEVVNTVSFALNSTLFADVAGTSHIELKTLPRFHDTQLVRLAAAVAEELADPNANGKLFLESLVHAIVARLVQHYAVTSARETPLKPARVEVQTAKNLLLANLAANPSLEALAHAVNLSPHHLRRVFKAETGQTLYTFLLHARLERACELLADEKSSVTEVAARCGFYDAAHLSRHFRRAYGCSPGELRRK